MIDPKKLKKNILTRADRLTVLMAGYSEHRSWWRKILSMFRYVPLESNVVAYFTQSEMANDYIQWASTTGPRPFGHRFRTDSVLAGYDRAWAASFFTDVPIDPTGPDYGSEVRNVVKLFPKKHS